MAMGRPTKMTDATIAKLEQAFLMGCRDAEACLFANINLATLYRYQQDNPDFCDRKETLKSNPVMLARKVQIDALKDGDINVAVKVIERADGTKKVIAGDADNPLSVTMKASVIAAEMSPEDAAKIYRDMLNPTSDRK